MSKISFTMSPGQADHSLDVNIGGVTVGVLNLDAGDVPDSDGFWRYYDESDHMRSKTLCGGDETVETAMSLCRTHLGEKMPSKQQLIDEMVKLLTESFMTQLKFKTPLVQVGVKRGHAVPGDNVWLTAPDNLGVLKELASDFANGAVTVLQGLLFPED